MPRKSKEELKSTEIIENNIEKKGAKKANIIKDNDTTSKKETSKSTKKTTSKKSAAAKTTTGKKISNATASTKKSVATEKKKTSKTASSSATKKESKKATAKAANKTSNTKAANKRATTSKKTGTTRKVVKSTKTKKMVASVEYYDLPYRYNETVVKILAQTPTMLFIYWDISDEDRSSYIEKYGDDFFSTTKPVLVVTNKTMNYSFEVEINDFANSWYLHVNDADCDYSVELGRRPIQYNTNIDNYIYVTTSNDMEMPNNHILLDKLGKSVFFRNVKNNFIEEKEITSISFLKNLGKVYNIYELYKEMYKDEIDNELNSTLKLNLSSSGSSTFK